jgi:hypothetical protein
MLPAAENVLVAGLYNSALASSGTCNVPPPVMSTVPSFNVVAVENTRTLDMFPVALKVVVEGSYSSALFQ